MDHPFAFTISDELVIGSSTPVFICGPCVVESKEVAIKAAEVLKNIFTKIGIPFIYKSSYDKANRTSGHSFRSIGFKPALEILRAVRTEFKVPILTDVHEVGQVSEVAEVADILQVPAFLCRQTDLIKAVAESGKVVNIKKGQFMAPEDMRFAQQKAMDTGNKKIFLTERGSTFGYHNLVVDMRSLAIMRRFAPVVFDLTHSVQMPGGLAGSSGGQKEFAPLLARAAAAAGVDGFFMETHPDPDRALSDGPNMIPLNQIQDLVISLKTVWEASRPYWSNSTTESK